MDPFWIRVFGMLGIGALAAWLIANRKKATRTILTVRNKVYFGRNGDKDWRDHLGEFSDVSVKIADGGGDSWKKYMKYARPLVEAARAAGANPIAWHFVYFSPWRAAGYGPLQPDSYKIRWGKYRGQLRDAKWRKWRKAYPSQEASARSEGLSAAAGMKELGITTIVINAEAGAFGNRNTRAVNGDPKTEPDTAYYKVSDWPTPWPEGGSINKGIQVYADTIRSVIPNAQVIYNGFSTKKITPATAERLDGWLPMRYATSKKGLAKGWKSALGTRPGEMAWGVMTGAKAPYFKPQFHTALNTLRPDMVAFFYGPGSRLGPTVEAARAVRAMGEKEKDGIPTA